MSVEREMQLVVEPEAAVAVVLNSKTGVMDLEFGFDEESGLDVEVSPDGKHVDLLVSGEGFQARLRMTPDDARNLAAELREFASGEDEE